jgi:precorrin-3B synthase
MTTAAIATPNRRGACPGLSAPMPTGDGLLVRLLPMGTVSLAAFGGLCAAARTHGNGVIEITSRGSIQVRGLNAASALYFADAVTALGIAAEDGVPIHCDPLAGLDGDEVFNALALAAELHRALARQSMAEKLNAKVSITIDGGGSLNLASLSADIRLCAQPASGEITLRVGIGGDEENAVDLGTVRRADGVEAVLRLLNVVARRGKAVRARDILATDGPAVFHAALSSCPALCRAATPYPKTRARDGLGPEYRLNDGSLAVGVGLAFGHTDPASLERLIEAAVAANAHSFRVAPGRTLMIIGLSRATAPEFVTAAEEIGFIISPNDPRRSVIACAGAPICASAHIATRTIAPRIAEAADASMTSGQTIHISGCAKGCAHAATATLTVVGTPDGCALVANGSARDAPFTTVAADQLPAAIARHARENKCEAAHV